MAGARGPYGGSETTEESVIWRVEEEETLPWGEEKVLETWLDLMCKLLMWYELCQDRKEWFKLCGEGIERVSETRQKNKCPANNQPQPSRFDCACGRSFRRNGDLTRHKRFCRHSN